MDLWLPEGSTIQETEAMATRFEARMMKEPGVETVSAWIGSRRAALLSAAGPDLSADQRVAEHPAGQGHRAARGLAQAAADAAGRGVPRGARPREAAAQRPAGALPGDVPCDGPRCARGARVGRRSAGDSRHRSGDARRQRQLERIDQVAQAARSTRTRRARSASPANRWRSRRARSCRAPRSASTARATSWSTSCCASRRKSATRSPTSAAPTCRPPAVVRCR